MSIHNTLESTPARFIISLIIFLSSLSQSHAQITLPIEVIGNKGLVRTITFQLDDTQRQSSEYLWMLANNLSYPDKGSIRVNDKAWVSLNNENVILSGNDKAYGGIGGALSSVKFKMPVIGLVNGENKISFRFNQSDGISIGYRIVKVNLLDTFGNEILSEEIFSEDDPSIWEPPYPGPQNIAMGKDFWYNAELKEHDLEGAKPIKAKCSSCHAQDGRDLKYFNYSNHSIIKRSEFHGLSHAQGMRIASYIRSLTTPAPEHARPWNPPYQPGSEVASRPVSEWAAGAGLEAVLEKDEDMIPYVFPQGVDKLWKLGRVIDSKKTLDLTTIPIAMQFPDWKDWLPVKHPMDVWEDGVFEGSRAENVYYRSRDSLETVGADGLIANGTLVNVLNTFNFGVRKWLGANVVKYQNGSSPWRALSGGVIEDIKVEPGETFQRSRQFAKMYLAQWRAVKYWEMMQEFELEGKSPDIYEHGEKRSWPFGYRGVHESAPHMVADNINNMPDQTGLAGDYLSSAWYQLQMTVNAGHRTANENIQPVDWPYQLAHIYELADRAKVYDPMRFLTTIVKMYQVRDNGEGPTNSGWTMRNVHPWWLYGSREGDPSLMNTLNSYYPHLNDRVIRVLVDEWIEVSESMEDEWERVSETSKNVDKWYQLEPADFVPTGVLLGDKEFRAEGDHANTLYKVIPLMKENNINCNTIHDLASWGKKMWPLGDWFALTDCSGTITVRARGEEGQERFELLVDDERVGDAIQVSTTYQDYVFNAQTSSGNIKVNFINGGAGNMQIDYIQINDDDVLQAENQEVNTGVWNWKAKKCGGLRREWLHCSGYIDFGNQSFRFGEQEERVESAHALFVYPNPVKDGNKVFTISSELNDYTLKIYDVRGGLVMHSKSLTGEVKVDVNDVREGIYIVNVSNGEQTFQERLIVE